MSDAYVEARNRIQRWYGAMHAGGHRQFAADLEEFEQAVREEAKRKVERLEAALFKIVQKAPFADREELSKIARRALTPSPEPRQGGE